MAGFPGFRRLARGSETSGADIFAGLETPREAEADRRVPDNLCLALFGPTGWAQGELPIAVFSDYFCPICLVFEKRLADLKASGVPLRFFYHELPLLGPRSRWTAQVALAAKRQGKHNAVHEDLLRRPLRPGPTGVHDLAMRHDLDPDLLWQDSQSAGIVAEIEAGLALGRALGIPGTPSTVFGRTLVIGALRDRDIAKLVSIELEAGDPGCS
jgi:protein-disulfide isomerase